MKVKLRMAKYISSIVFYSILINVYLFKAVADKNQFNAKILNFISRNNVEQLYPNIKNVWCFQVKLFDNICN